MGTFSKSSPAASTAGGGDRDSNGVGGSQEQSQPQFFVGRLKRVFSRKNGSKKYTRPQKLAADETQTDMFNRTASLSSFKHQRTSSTNDDFTDEQMKKLKNAFDFFDIDNDGRISSVELRRVLKFLGNGVTEEEARLMIAEVDENRNGAVEFDEFTKMMSKYHRTMSQQSFGKFTASTTEEAEILETFQAFDHNGDNYIDFVELKKTMQFLGEFVSDRDVECMIRQADMDKDGRINLEEFKLLLEAMKSGRAKH